MDTKPLCAKHRSEVKIWHGQGCGEAGWGPGHRLPAGLTVADVDRQVALIKGFCRDGRNCGDTAHEWKCDSRDRCEQPAIVWQLPNSPVRILVHESDVIVGIETVS